MKQRRAWYLSLDNRPLRVLVRYRRKHWHFIATRYWSQKRVMYWEHSTYLQHKPLQKEHAHRCLMGVQVLVLYALYIIVTFVVSTRFSCTLRRSTKFTTPGACTPSLFVLHGNIPPTVDRTFPRSVAVLSALAFSLFARTCICSTHAQIFMRTSLMACKYALNTLRSTIINL